MVGVVSDPLVAEPGKYIESQFSNARVSANEQPCADIPQVVERFRPYLESPEFKAQVPSINLVDLQRIPSGTLVRYKGMVRDMMNPEFYTGAYRLSTGEWRTTKYTELAHPDMSMAVEKVMWERKPYFCAAVPGEAKWVKDMEMGLTSLNFTSHDDATERQKRARNDNETAGSMHDHLEGDTDSDVPSSSKRMDVDDDQSTQQQRCSSQCASESSAQEVSDANLGESPCLLKVYEDSKLDDLKLNDVVEVLGVLSSDPRLTLFGGGDQNMGEEITEEDLANNPPASRVPRLHVIIGQKVNCYGHLRHQMNVAYRPLEATIGKDTDVLQDTSKLGRLRQELLCILSDSLAGDALAAEYLLLNMLGSIQRTEGSGPDQLLVGKHTLNICNCGDSELASTLSQTLQTLLPRSRSMILSRAAINGEPMWPRKDYQTNRLVGGPLMLADETLLLVDECIEEGHLSSVGLQNFEVIKELVTSQSLKVDYQYYSLEIKKNLPVISVSATRSLLPCDTTVKLAPAAVQTHTQRDSTLEELRRFIAVLQSSHADFVIGPEVAQVIQEDYIKRRQAKEKDEEYSYIDLHKVVNLARLLSKSYGEKELTIQRWQQINQMEEARLNRLH